MTTQSTRQELARLLSLHSKEVQLKPHVLVSTPESRHEGLVCPESAQDILFEQALNDCPHDMYLGLKWYKSDPLPAVICVCEEYEVKFVDGEFPVHDNIHLEVSTSNEESVKCIPGVITSSNCRDFATVPKRVPRIQHFVNKAKFVNGGWSWKRASILHDSKCQLFSASIQSIDPRNVLQGKVGNCGFCSGIASLAAGHPDVIQQTFGENSQLAMSKYGAVSVLMYPRRQPRYLLLDDFILCKNERDCDAYHGRNPPSPSMHSLLPTDVWVRLLEKAFVKVQGSIASLDGYYKYNSLYRHPARAMQLLTGAPLAMEVHYSMKDADLMYKILSSSHGRYAKVVHCRKRFEGLIPNHGYSLLWVGQASGGHWVCLRNPHGQGSYKGSGCDGFFICNDNKEDEFPTCLKVCSNTGRVVWNQGNSQCHHAFSVKDCNHDNGIFFMPFSIFIECFPITTLVGPIESKEAEIGADADHGFFDGSEGKDYVHEVHPENLVQLHKIVTN